MKKQRDFGLDKTNTMDLFAEEAQPRDPTPQRADPAATATRDSSVKKQSWMEAAMARRSSDASKEGTHSAGGAQMLPESVSKNLAGPTGPRASSGSAGESGRPSVGVRMELNDRLASESNSKGKRHSEAETGRRLGESSHKKGAVTPGSAAGHAVIAEPEQEANAQDTPGHGAFVPGDGGDAEGGMEEDIRQADACVGSILEQLAPLTEDDGYRNPFLRGHAAASPSPAASVQHGECQRSLKSADQVWTLLHPCWL